MVVGSGAWLLPGLSKQELEPFFRLQNPPQRYPKPPKLLPRSAPEEVTAGGTMPLGGKGGEEEEAFLLLGNISMVQLFFIFVLLKMGLNS